MDGDLRNIKLAKILAKEDDNFVYVFGLEKADELRNIDNIIFCESLESVVNKSTVVITAIPFSRDGLKVYTPFGNNELSIKELVSSVNDKILIAGGISNIVYDLINENTSKNIKVIDIMKQEELVILNTIATAEGTIQTIIENTDFIIHKSKILVLGFGRVGKVSAKKLQALDAKVTCSARKVEDIAWINTYGYDFLDINDLGNSLKDYDIIINTIPNIILDENNLKYVRKDCLLIDLASAPGGIDRTYVEKEKLNFVWALALPGKIAPLTTADFIKNTIYNVLDEKKI